MKQLVIRKTVEGDFTEFTFEKKGNSFLVKNFTEGDAFVTFEGDDEETSIKVPSGYLQECIVRDWHYATPSNCTNTIYIKANGEVEVQLISWV